MWTLVGLSKSRVQMRQKRAYKIIDAVMAATPATKPILVTAETLFQVGAAAA